MARASKTLRAINGRPRLLRLLAFLSLLLAAPAYSQSLGDVARQERERKRNQPRRATHVYDNNDLARSQILLPEDRERAQALKEKITPAASEPVVEAAGSEPEMNALPLGDIAQRYRTLKTDRQEPKSQSRAGQPALSAPLLAYPAFSPPPVRPSAPLHVVNTQKEHAGKTMRSEKIDGVTRVRVQPGDTLWKLAGKYLGRGKDWLLLAAINPRVTDLMRLQVGTWVRLPDEAPNFQPPKRVRVERGDSLWKLSLANFGNGSAWTCIAQANPQLQNAELIFPGQILTIPGSCTATPLPRVRHLAVSSESLPSSTAQLLR
jgi:nucleoid-associated protein YgaU